MRFRPTTVSNNPTVSGSLDLSHIHAGHNTGRNEYMGQTAGRSLKQARFPERGEPQLSMGNESPQQQFGVAE